MIKTLDCPYCDGKAELLKENRNLTFRKESFEIVAHFYKCTVCNEQFTTTETDNLSYTQVLNLYRERNKIPFTEEIIAIREKYSLPAVKMSEVLGLGTNGYSNYEKGEIPTHAIGNLIRLAADAHTFISLAEKSNVFSDTSLERLQKRIRLIQEKPDYYYESLINQFKEPTAVTGYRIPSVNKISNLMLRFLETGKEVFNDKLKLNKLLFYTDFYHFKETGYSLTGITYRSIQYGPVPTNYDNIFMYLLSGNLISSIWCKDKYGAAREIFKSDVSFESQHFNESEMQTINFISEKFKDTNSWDLVDMSHKERAWIETKQKKSPIDYQKFAFDLLEL